MKVNWDQLGVEERLNLYPTLTIQQATNSCHYIAGKIHQMNLRREEERIVWARLEEEYKLMGVSARLQLLPDLTREQASNINSYYEAESQARVNRIGAKDYAFEEFLRKEEAKQLKATQAAANKKKRGYAKKR